MKKIRLSHSALELLVSCERKFQLERLLVGAPDREDSAHTVFGTAFGAGVASYMEHQDQDIALYELWKSYFPIIEEGVKTEEQCIGLFLSIVPTLDNLLMDWEVMTFENKPAVELSFCLDIDDKFYFVGYIDIVLRNRFTGKAAIMEVKTTSLGITDLDPLYKNSGQALGYSIVLDRIMGEAKSEYEVIYVVGQINSKTPFSFKPHVIPYAKTIHDRLDWFITLGMDVNRLHAMLDMNVFPRRGASCLKFMRACPHLGICNLHGLDEYKELEEDLNEYQFHYELDTLIKDHLERVNTGA